MRKLAFVMLALCACSEAFGPDGGPSAADVGEQDSGASDGALDAASDASAPDATASDSGHVDAGASDSGAADAGVLDVPDAGPATCEVVDVVFECQDVTACAGTPLYDRCGSAPRNACCVTEDICSVDGAPGVCLDVAVCGGVSTPGRCPGPTNIQCCTRPEEACGARDHPRPNAGLAEVSQDPSCPAGMVVAGAYCIDRYEASLETLDGVAWSPYASPGSTPVRARAIGFAVPQAYISQVAAAGACAAAGKRLCTDAEWVAACRGAQQWIYPYGDVREPGRCNDARDTHPAYEYFGTTDGSVFSMLDHACLDQLPAGLALTGEHVACESPVGAFDMMGNLHEWTADPAGTFRGGFFVDTRINGDGCLYRTTAHGVGYSDYSTGFRCCADLP